MDGRFPRWPPAPFGFPQTTPHMGHLPGPYGGFKPPDLQSPGMPARGPAPMPTPGMPSPERPADRDQWRELARSSRLGNRFHIKPQAGGGGGQQQLRMIDVALDRPEAILIYLQVELFGVAPLKAPINVTARALWGSGGAVMLQEYLWAPRGIAIQLHASSVMLDIAATGNIPGPDGFTVLASASPGIIGVTQLPDPVIEVPAATGGFVATGAIPQFAQTLRIRQGAQRAGAFPDQFTLTWQDLGGNDLGQPTDISDTLVVGVLGVPGGETFLLPIPQEATQWRIDVSPYSPPPTVSANSFSLVWEIVT